jgi:hypothetical protein
LELVHARVSGAGGKAVPDPQRTAEVDIWGGELWLAP